MSEVCLEVRPEAPISFRVVKFLSRRGIRGSSRLECMLRRRGAFDRPLAIALSPTVSLETPIGRPDNFWDETDVRNYDRQLFAGLRSLIHTLPRPALFIDGGADIGLYSARMVAENPSISFVRAFEPNYESYHWLERNIGKLPIQAKAQNAALADFTGKGHLVTPPYDASEHARYLEPSANGPVAVTTIDSEELPVAPTLILKLDLEGGEPAALRGAAFTIQRAERVVAILEAHRLVAARTKSDPCTMLEFLAGLRPFSFHVGTNLGPRIDPRTPFYKQFAGAPRNVNIVAISA